MSESESEDEILDRIEAALRKIAGAANTARPAMSAGFDHELLGERLDGIIARLRTGLAMLRSEVGG